MLTGWSRAKNFYLCILFLLLQLLFHLHLLLISVIPSIPTPESSNDFIILIISFTSSFKINKVSTFPALTASLGLVFLSNLFIAFEVKLLTNQGKMSLAE